MRRSRARHSRRLLPHFIAALVGLLTSRQLARQLWQRHPRSCARCCAGRSDGAAAPASAATTAAEGAGQPLLPLTAPASAASTQPPPPTPPLVLAPWTSLATAELFLAGYASAQFAASQGAPSQPDPTLLLLFGRPSPTHVLTLICAAMLAASAASRALQLACYERHVAALATAHAAELAKAAAQQTPSKKPAKPIAKACTKGGAAARVEEERQPPPRKPRVPTLMRPTAAPPPPKTPPPAAGLPPPPGWLAWLPGAKETGHRRTPPTAEDPPCPRQTQLSSMPATTAKGARRRRARNPCSESHAVLGQSTEPSRASCLSCISAVRNCISGDQDHTHSYRVSVSNPISV